MSTKKYGIALVYRRSQIQTMVEFYQVEQPELTRIHGRLNDSLYYCHA